MPKIPQPYNAGDTGVPAPETRSLMRRILPFFIMAHAGHHFITSLPQAMLPFFQTEFSLSYTQAALVPMAFAISVATSQLAAGWIADKSGPVLLIAIGTVGVALGGVFVGLSQSFIMLLIGLVIIGILSGGYHPAATPLLTATMPPEQRGRALGFHLIGGNSAFFVAPIIAASIGAAWGWRSSFFVMAVPAIVTGIVFYLYLTRHAGRHHVAAVKKNIDDDMPVQPGYRRRLTAFIIMVVLGSGGAVTMMAFLTLYMKNELGASDAMATGLLAIISSSGIWAAPLGGYLGEKIGSVKVVIISTLLLGAVVLGFKFVTLGWSLYIMLFLFGICLAISMPVTEMFIMAQSPARKRSTIFGVYYSTMQYTGAIFALPAGYLIENFGFHDVFTWVSVGIVAVVVISSFFIYDAKDNYRPETTGVG